MKRIINLAFLAIMIMGTTTLFTSCGSDENGSDNNGNNGNAQINPKKVFKGGIPKEIIGRKFQVNQEGLVEKIYSDIENMVVVFYYAPKDYEAKKKNVDVLMTVHDKDGAQDFYMTVGSNGFIKHAYNMGRKDNEDELNKRTWDFEYDKDGHLIKAYYSKKNVTSTLKYEDGNIVEVKHDYALGVPKNKSYSIYYTSKEVIKPMVNIGCIMFYKPIFDIDMDELDFTYYAGLLGTATKNLPQKRIDEDGDIVGRYAWVLNAQAYPFNVHIYNNNENHQLYDIHW